jgi:hypothetical protein
MGAPATDQGKADNPPPEVEDEQASRALTSGGQPNMDATAAADRVAELAKAAVNDAKAAVNDAEAVAAQATSNKSL